MTPDERGIHDAHIIWIAAVNAGGEAMQLAGHRITVYRRQPDGRWLLARDAHTLSPVGEPHPA